MSLEQIIILAGILVFNFWLRSRFRNQPLDWDHGIYGYLNYWYQKMGKNIIPVYDKSTSLISWGKPGLTYLMWLVVKICGTNPRKIRDFDSIWYLLNTLGVFWLGHVAFGTEVGLLAAALYAFYSSLPFTWTADLNPENYQAVFLTLSFGAFLKYLDSGSEIWMIVSGGSAFLTMLLKQNSLFYFGGILLFELLILKDFRGIQIFMLSLVIPYVLLFSFYLKRGITLKMLLGNFLIYPSMGGISYIMNLTRENSKWVRQEEKVPIIEQLRINLKAHMRESGSLWLIGLIGLGNMALSPVNPENFLLLTLFIGMVAGFILPRKFYPYYFLPFIPLLSIAGSYLIVEHSSFTLTTVNGVLSAVTIGALAFLTLLSTPNLFNYFFRALPTQQGLYQYKHSLPNFLASEKIARYIKDNSNEDDKIFVWNLNPEIYFLSERRSAVGHLMFNSNITRTVIDLSLEDIFFKMMDDLVINEAKYVVLVTEGLSRDMIRNYTNLEYDLVERFDTGLGFDESRAYSVYELNQSSLIPALNKMGEKYFHRGDYKTAVNIFQNLTMKEPDSAEHKTNLAAALWDAGERNDSRLQVEKALEVQPDYKDAIISYCEIAENDSEKVMAASYCANYLENSGYDGEIAQQRDQLSERMELEVE